MHRISIALLIPFWAGCGIGDERGLDDGDLETKPARHLDAVSGLDAEAADVTHAQALFQVSVTSPSGAVICKGQVAGEIHTGFSFQVPDGKIKCAQLTIDLENIIKLPGLVSQFDLGAVDPAHMAEQGPPVVSDDGRLLYLSRFGQGEITPPRPVLVGPVIQDPGAFEGFHYEKSHSISTPDKTADGTVVVDVLETNGTYENDLGESHFDHILHWQMTTTGFDGVGLFDGRLFSEIEVFWNTDPMMVPKVRLKGDLLGALVGGGDVAEFGEGLLGETTVLLELIDYRLND